MIGTETAALIFDAAATVVNAACVVTVWFARRGFAQRSEMGGLGQRILLLEQGPNWTMINEIRDDFGKMEVLLGKMEVKLEIRAATIDRIDQYLRERGK